MKTAHYCRFGEGRSARALEAEARGLLPATRAGKALGVPGRFIRECCKADEWHHVEMTRRDRGKFTIPCNYYHVGKIREALQTFEGKTILALWRAYGRARRRGDWRAQWEAEKAIEAVMDLYCKTANMCVWKGKLNVH